MSNRTLDLTDELYDYILSVSVHEDEHLQRLRKETAGHPYAIMQISPEQGQFMAFLARLIGAKRIIEVGVFTGYSSYALASALPPDGELIACDVNEEWTSIARRYWKEGGLESKIKLHLAPAIETMEQLLKDGQKGAFDFVFIDADKENYENYYEKSLELIRAGGIIAIDNVLWGGKVTDAKVTDTATEAIRRFNKKLYEDERINLSLIPIADGLTLAHKR